DVADHDARLSGPVVDEILNGCDLVADGRDHIVLYEHLDHDRCVYAYSAYRENLLIFAILAQGKRSDRHQLLLGRSLATLTNRYGNRNGADASTLFLNLNKFVIV